MGTNATGGEYEVTEAEWEPLVAKKKKASRVSTKESVCLKPCGREAVGNDERDSGKRDSKAKR